MVSEWDSAEAAERGLPVGPMELEGPGRGSAWESFEGEGSVAIWVPGVRGFLLAGSVPGLDGCFTCPSAAGSGLTWLWRGREGQLGASARRPGLCQLPSRIRALVTEPAPPGARGHRGRQSAHTRPAREHSHGGMRLSCTWHPLTRTPARLAHGTGVPPHTRSPARPRGTYGWLPGQPEAPLQPRGRRAAGCGPGPEALVPESVRERGA